MSDEVDKKDVAVSILNAIKKNEEKPEIHKGEVTRIEPYDPVADMEKSLSSFLKHRLKKLQDDSDFEEEIKQQISARLEEASFTQLVSLLNTLQKNSNIGTEKVLSPFIAQSGDRTLLDNRNKKSPIEEDLFEKLSSHDAKDILQGLNQLGTLIEEIKEKKDSNIK